MNLLSPLYEFTITGTGSDSGTLRVYYSLNRSAIGSGISTLAYEVDVASVDSTYRIDLVSILSSYFHPLYVHNSDVGNVLKYRVTFQKVGGSETDVSGGTGTFYYSDTDVAARSYITTKFGGYSIPLTAAESVIVVKDGISTTYSDSGSKMLILSAPTTSLTIGGVEFEVACNDAYQIDYINAEGVWSFFLPDGNCYRSDSVSGGDAIRYVRYGSNLRKLHTSYKQVITPQFTINSGWLDEVQSAELVHGLLESPYLILHTENIPSGFPVKVVDGSFSYLDHHKDAVMNHSFVLESLVPLIKY